MLTLNKAKLKHIIGLLIEFNSVI